MTNANHIAAGFETGAFAIAGGLAAAAAHGAARHEAVVAAAAQVRVETRTLDAVQTVARAMAADRLKIRRLEAEIASLRAELRARDVRDAAVARRDGRRAA